MTAVRGGRPNTPAQAELERGTLKRGVVLRVGQPPLTRVTSSGDVPPPGVRAPGWALLLPPDAGPPFRPDQKVKLDKTEARRGGLFLRHGQTHPFDSAQGRL